MDNPFSFGANSTLKISFHLRLLIAEVPPPTRRPESQAENCNHCVAPEIFAECQNTREHAKHVACQEDRQQGRQDQLEGRQVHAL